MAEQTKIEWCDATFNPWIGCTRISPACDNCYAARSTPVRTRGIEWGPGKKRHRTAPENWKQVERWNRDEFMQCANCKWRGDQNAWRGLHASRCCAQPMLDPARRRVFCASLADWLDNEVEIEVFVDLLDLIRRCPNLDFLMLTKRIGRWPVAMEDALDYTAVQGPAELYGWLKQWRGGSPPANVWLGATIINQEEADRDIPKLLQVPARISFLSVEPMLGPVDLEAAWHGESALDSECWGDCSWCRRGFTPLHNCAAGKQTEAACSKGRSGVDWVIAGGESGPKARPLHPDWIRSLRDQCAEAGVPFTFKQWGEWAPYDRGQVDSQALASPGSLDTPVQKFGKKAAGNLLDGRQHLEWPA